MRVKTEGSAQGKKESDTSVGWEGEEAKREPDQGELLEHLHHSPEETEKKNLRQVEGKRKFIVWIRFEKKRGGSRRRES